MAALLEAINRALGAVSLPATSTLAAPVPPHVAMARRLVEEEDRSAQTEGWHFNTLQDVTYYPDEVTGKVEAPATAIAFTVRGDDWRELSIRSGFFYDLAEDTDVFTKPIRGRVLLQLALDDTPPYYRDYLGARAARRLEAQYRGEPASSRDAYAAELIARGNALRLDGAAARHNSITTEAVFRTYGTRLRRRR